MRWMHKVRLYATPSQERRLWHVLHTTRHLYNAALQERKDAYRMRGVSVSAKMQYAELTALRADDPGVRSIYRECQDAILHRLDLAFAAFFRRIKRGDTPGFPRFRAASRWKQIEFPHGDRALKLNAAQTKVRVAGVGTVAMRKGRAVPAFGRAFVVEKNGRWYAVFECECEAVPLERTRAVVGLDCGITELLATSDGALFANPRHIAARAEKSAAAGRVVAARTVRDSRGRCANRHDPARVAAVKRLARAREREADARRDALHKLSRRIVNDYDGIAVEALVIRNMLRSAKGTVEEPGRNVAAKSGLNRSIADAGWGTLVRLIREKAESAGRVVVSVDPKNTSRCCAQCGHIAADSRDGVRFACVKCGHRDHADVNAARVILQRAQLALLSALSPGSTRFRQHDAD
jgi:putative transposase